jgi:hypothetical protein
MSNETFTVASSAGELTVRLSDGAVVAKTIHDPEDDSGLGTIVRVDVEEFARRYPDRPLTHLDTIDVQDLVSWSDDGEIHEPDEEWRAEREELRASLLADDED